VCLLCDDAETLVGVEFLGCRGVSEGGKPGDIARLAGYPVLGGRSGARSTAGMGAAWTVEGPAHVGEDALFGSAGDVLHLGDRSL